MPKVLNNIRVVDITRYVAGPMCAAQLADLGADVIHVEDVGGGEDRTPLPVDPDYPGGAGFIQVNRNKRSIGLNLKSAEGNGVLKRIVANSDIVVSNVPPRASAALGIDYESLCALRPDIIAVEITSFGRVGPYANRTGFDAIAQVMSGATHLSGWPEQPMKSAAAWVDMTAANHATTGALAALLHRQASGEGQRVEVNLWRSALTITNYFLTEELLTGMARGGIGNRAPSGGPADLVQTKDGAIYVAVLGNPMFRRYAELIGNPDLLHDPALQTDEGRADHGERLSQETAEWAGNRTTSEALAALADARIPAGPLLTPKQILEDEHVRQSGYLRHVAVPGLPEPIPYVQPAYTLSASPASIEAGPPAPGEHTDEILRELGYAATEIDELRRAAAI